MGVNLSLDKICECCFLLNQDFSDNLISKVGHRFFGDSKICTLTLVRMAQKEEEANMRNIYDKIVGFRAELVERCQRAKRSQKTLVLTTGVWDLLHEGHLVYLTEARMLGDFLAVGVNSDAHVKTIKGSGRPIINERQRAFMVAGFECVDLVYTFDDRLDIVKAVEPSVFVMSETSHANPNEGERLVQQQVVKEKGGRVVIFGPQRQCSTTEIIRRIRCL